MAPDYPRGNSWDEAGTWTSSTLAAYIEQAWINVYCIVFGVGVEAASARSARSADGVDARRLRCCPGGHIGDRRVEVIGAVEMAVREVRMHFKKTENSRGLIRGID